jgi:Tol biopolymer transport system component
MIENELRAWIPWILGCWAVVALGCASPGLPLEELSDRPIAFVYWEENAARERYELTQDVEKGRETGPTRRGVARLGSVAGLLAREEPGAARGRLGELPGRIALLNPRTLELTRFPAAPPNARPLAWSRDRGRLLFASQHRDNGRTQLYEYLMESQEVRKLTRGPAYHLEGDYGPDGRLVISWVSLGGQQSIAGLDVRPAGGGRPTELLRGAYPMSVRWSPKGDTLLYVRADDRPLRSETQRDLSEIIVRGPTPESGNDVLARGREPVFSPDGEWVVFSAQTPKGWRLRRMRPNGSARTGMGSSGLDERNPTISPDGEHIVYISPDAGIDRLYVRRMDGSGNRILLTEGSAAFPVW